MNDAIEAAIKDAAIKAQNAKSGDEAMKYMQAACNGANALCALREAKK